MLTLLEGDRAEEHWCKWCAPAS